MTMHTMADAVIKLVSDQAAGLLTANGDGITEELLAAEDSKLTVSLSLKLSLVAGKVYSTASVSFSRKFRDEIEGSADADPNQEKLALGGSGKGGSDYPKLRSRETASE